MNPISANLLIFSKIALRREGTTGIWANHWDTKHVEVHDSSNGPFHIVPSSVVISEPVLSILTRASECASTESEGPIFGVSAHGLVKKELSSSFGLKMSEERVNIVLGHVVAWMGSIERHGHVVEVDSTWDEWQEVGAVFLLTLGRHVPGVVREALVFIIIDNHEFGSRSFDRDWAFSSMFLEIGVDVAKLFSESSLGRSGVVWWCP